MKADLLSFQSALMTTGVVHPVSTTSHGGTAEILCRQVPGTDAAWLERINRMLDASQKAGFHDQLLIGRRYLLKDGKMVFAWCIRLGLKTAKALSEAIPRLTEALLSAPSIPVEVAKAPATMAPKVKYGKAPPQKVDLSRYTLARPRPPNPGKDPKPPKGFKSALKQEQVKRDSGQVETHTVISLPHVFEDKNKPKAGSTKGALGVKESK